MCCEWHELKYQPIQNKEYNCVAAATPENIGRFMENLIAIMKTYSVADPSPVFKIDESGASLGKILRKSGKSAFGNKNLGTA